MDEEEANAQLTRARFASGRAETNTQYAEGVSKCP